MKVDLYEVFSNFVPQMEDNSPLTPDRSLNGGSVKHNEVENNVDWSLDNNEKTPLSDRTSITGVETESENWSQVHEEEESRTAREAVIFDSLIEQVRYSMSLRFWRVPWAHGKMTPSVSHRPTVFILHYREMNGTRPPTYSMQRQGNQLRDTTHFGTIGR